MKKELYYGDCTKLMCNIPDKSIDLICADLPYAVTQHKLDIKIPLEDYIEIEYKPKKFKNINLNEWLLFQYKQGIPYDISLKLFNKNKKDGLWTHYNRIIKDNGAILLYGQGKFFVELINSNLKNFRYDIVWDKHLVSDFLNSKRKPLRVHEQIAVFYKKQPTYNPQMVVGKPLHSKGKSYINKNETNNNYGEYGKGNDSRAGETLKYPKTIISYQKPHPSKALHRTEKSIQCTEWLIKTYSNEGDLVLDNVAGSGTTGVACENTNRNYILMDNDYKNIEIMENRLNIEHIIYGKPENKLKLI